MCSWLVTLLSLLALGAQCLSQECNTNITILINGNGTKTLPKDNWLTLETNLTNLNSPIIWSINDQNQCTINQTICVYPFGILNDGDTFNVTVTNGTDSFLLFVVVEAGAVVCRDLTFGILLEPIIMQSCIPVARCTYPGEISAFDWEIRYRLDDKWEVLESDSYMPPDFTGLMLEDGDNIEITDGGKTLTIMSVTEAMVGYYRVVGDGMTLSSFTVFLRVIPEETYRQSVNVVEGRSEIFIPCRFMSFPQVSVTWLRVFENGSTVNLKDLNSTGKYILVDINETEDEIVGSEQDFDLTLSVDGGLIINDVVIEDHGVYECVGSNGFVSTTESLIFRVRDNLRPLWPALGIIGVFITTAMFISASYLIQRLKEDKERTIGPSEVDGEQEGFQGRPSMISMDADEENALVQKRIHSDGITK